METARFNILDPVYTRPKIVSVRAYQFFILTNCNLLVNWQDGISGTPSLPSFCLK